MLGVAEADLELEDAFVHMKGGRACGSRSPELVDLLPMFSGCSSCEPDVLDQSGGESRRSVKSTSHVDVTGRPGAGHVGHSAARDCRKSWRTLCPSKDWSRGRVMDDASLEIENEWLYSSYIDI
jgi:hypothetical protein